MKENWAVTYSIATPESSENGDYAECGFEYENTSFRDAMRTFACGQRKAIAESADSWPVDGSVRWFDSPVMEDRAFFEKGEDRHLSLHIPEQITPSSRKRLARYLGLKVK